MRPSRIVLLLVAILAGGLAAFLATRGDAPVRQAAVAEPQVIEEKKTQILVALAPIGVGERLSQLNVEWQDWPEGAVRPEYINVATTPDALTAISGSVARFEIFAGEPVISQKLIRTEQGYLSAVLDKGRRGVSISVTAESASGGFIVPNDHVDVVLTRQADTGQISETILQNVKVLAIGTRLGETGATGAPADPENPRAEIFADSAIATLDLDPVQAETVINAARIGPLSLVLRSIADFDAAADETVHRSANQAVKIIKFGNQSSVMAGSNSAAPPPAATVDPVSYTPPADLTFAPSFPAESDPTFGPTSTAP
jgi:pilus assembly protein CpaB